MDEHAISLLIDCLVLILIEHCHTGLSAPGRPTPVIPVPVLKAARKVQTPLKQHLHTWTHALLT